MEARDDEQDETDPILESVLEQMARAKFEWPELAATRAAHVRLLQEYLIVWQAAEYVLHSQARSVRLFAGGHIRRRLLRLRNIYRQLAAAPSDQGAEWRADMRRMSDECEEFAGTLPSWQALLLFLVSVSGVVLTISGAVVAAVGIDRVAPVVLTILGGMWIVSVFLIVDFFSAFRRKRQLFYPALSTRFGRRSAEPLLTDRNVYWSEHQLFEVLRRPRPREAAIDCWAVELIVGMVALATTIFLLLDDHGLAYLVPLLGGVLAVFAVDSRTRGRRHWR